MFACGRCTLAHSSTGKQNHHSVLSLILCLLFSLEYHVCERKWLAYIVFKFIRIGICYFLMCSFCSCSYPCSYSLPSRHIRSKKQLYNTMCIVPQCLGTLLLRSTDCPVQVGRKRLVVM